MNSITFSQIVDGYLLAANARHLSPHTIQDYITTFNKFIRFLHDDPPIDEISVKVVESFLAGQMVSKKTILNYHIGLSALWTWAVSEGLTEEHIIRKVKRIKPEKPAIKPYSEEDIRNMLSVIGRTHVYSRPGKRDSYHRIPHADRNRAMIYLLLDTGIRVPELINLHIQDVDLRNRRIYVMGKGSKERTIPFSPRTGQMIWKYLTSRKESSLGELLLVTNDSRQLMRSRILRILRTIGQRAGVMKVNVHRFRHTFAVNYLRNGGDAYSLQMMLGHSTMEMVKTYLAMDGDDICGYCINWVDENKNRQTGMREGWVEALGVVPGWRGKGVASAILGHTMNEFRSMGLEYAALDVDTQNPSGALRLYEKLGFEAVKRTITFTKVVTPGAT